MSLAGFQESFVFIRRNIPGSVFSEPKVSSKKIPFDVMTNWESQSLSIVDWSTEFQAVDGTVEVLTSAEEIQTEAEFLVESSLMRTPGKRKKDSFSGEEFEGPLPGWKNPRYARSFPEDPIELETLIEEGVSKVMVTSTLSKIETYIEDMGLAVEEATSIHHDRLTSLEDNLETMIGMMQTLKSRVGSSLDIGERFTAPTLWGSTAFISDELTKLSDDMVELHTMTIKPIQESLVSLSSKENDISNKTEKVVRVVKLLLARVQAINESVLEVKTDLVMVRTEQSVGFNGPGLDRDDTDELMDYVVAEEGGRGHVRHGQSSGAVPLVSPAKKVVREGDGDSDEGVMTILTKLIDDVKTLQSSKPNTTIKFGGLGIAHLSDCAEWIKKNFSGHQYGLIMDPLLMLDRIYGEDEVVEGSLLKGMDLQDKMNIGSAASICRAVRRSGSTAFRP